MLIAMFRDDGGAAQPERVLQELSHDLMSPYCPGRTIASCPSGLARKLEDRIYTEAKAGKSREQIEEQLVAEFGPDIRGYQAPPAIVWGSWGLAFMAVLLIMVLGRKWVRRGRMRAAGATAAAPASESHIAPEDGSAKVRPSPLSARDRERLEDALDEEEGF